MFEYGEMSQASTALADPGYPPEPSDAHGGAQHDSGKHDSAHHDSAHHDGAHHDSAHHDDAKRDSGKHDTVRELQARIKQMQRPTLDTTLIPTHPAIAPLLPGGGLRQGAAYSVDSSVTLIMALLAGPSAAGAWCGVVGVPEFGVAAAAQHGIDLERLVLVPHPEEQWLRVTAAIADVVGVVVTKPPVRTSDGTVARLAARLRERGSTLLVLGPWPQTEAMLSLSENRWRGIGDGHGHLAAREATVTVSSRAGGRPRSARLWLPDAEGRITSSTPRFSTVPLERAG